MVSPHRLCRSILAWCPCLLYCCAAAVAWRRVVRVIITSPAHEIIAETMAGGFVCLTVPLSMYQIITHLCHFYEPRQQSQIVRIICTVPVYSISSWLSLHLIGHHYSDCAKYVLMIREVYEAVVLLSFMNYLIYFIDADADSLGSRLASKPAITGQHKPPFCCLSSWQMGAEFLRNCKFGVIQYVLMRVLTTLLSVALEHAAGLHSPHVRTALIVMQVSNAASQTWALCESPRS